MGRHCDYVLCSNICCLCCSTFRFTTQRSKFHCQFHFLDLEFVKIPRLPFFLAVLFFGQKNFIYLGCTGIFFFVIIQGFPPGYFDDPSILILAQIFGKRRGFFWISEISLFHFLDLEFDRISAAFCCSANSFFGGTAVFFVMILLDDESLDDDDFRWSSLVITVCLTLFPYFWRLIRQRLQVIIAEVVRLTTMIVINVRNKIPEVFVRVTQIE